MSSYVTSDSGAYGKVVAIQNPYTGQYCDFATKTFRDNLVDSCYVTLEKYRSQWAGFGIKSRKGYYISCRGSSFSWVRNKDGWEYWDIVNSLDNNIVQLRCYGKDGGKWRLCSGVRLHCTTSSNAKETHLRLVQKPMSSKPCSPAVLALVGKSVTVQSVNAGIYLCGNDGWETRGKAAGWETFTLRRHPAGGLALRDHSGHYLSVTGNCPGTRSLACDTTSLSIESTGQTNCYTIRSRDGYFRVDGSRFRCCNSTAYSGCEWRICLK